MLADTVVPVTASLGTATGTVTDFVLVGVSGTAQLGTVTAVETRQDIHVTGFLLTTNTPQVVVVVPEFNTDNPAARWTAPTSERSVMQSLRRLENQLGRTPLTYAHRLVFEDATVRDSDQMLLVATTVASVTITLPPAKSVLGRQFTVLKTTADANDVTVEGSNGEPINGAANVTWNNQYGGQTFMACQINIPAVFGWVLLV